MPETIEVSPGITTSSSQQSLNVVGVRGVGCDGQNLMAAAAEEHQRTGQKFLFISRRTTTTVFANHDQKNGCDVVDGGVLPKQVRRQFSCQHYPPETGDHASSHPTETHFEWQGQEKKGSPKGSVLLLHRSKDDLLDGGRGSNKIRLKIVW